MRTRTLSMRATAAALGIFAAGAWGQTINDGNFDALAIGTPPDNAAPAGAWHFPANYIAAVLGELVPTNYSIVATGAVPGNSLRMDVNDAIANIHMTNILPAVINEAPGQTVRVRFRVFVPAGGAWGGGSIYIGADMGGGGFNNATDRGPQLTWFPNGTITHAHLVGAVVTNTVIVPAYPLAAWQDVRLDIHLATDTFDAYCAHSGGALMQVGANLAFRSAPINKIDRFSFAHFGATVANSVALYDDITIDVLPCYPDCNTSGTLTVADFICFQGQFVAGNLAYADCNTSGTLTVADFVCYQGQFVAGCP